MAVHGLVRGVQLVLQPRYLRGMGDKKKEEKVARGDSFVYLVVRLKGDVERMTSLFLVAVPKRRQRKIANRMLSLLAIEATTE